MTPDIPKLPGEWVVRWAHMHVGHTVPAYLSESDWEDDGFGVDEDGDPVLDCNGNTVAKFTEEAFDTTNRDHVRLACEYATSDGSTDRDEITSWLKGEFGLTDEQIEQELGEYFKDNCEIDVEWTYTNGRAVVSIPAATEDEAIESLCEIVVRDFPETDISDWTDA